MRRREISPLNSQKSAGRAKACLPCCVAVPAPAPDWPAAAADGPEREDTAAVVEVVPRLELGADFVPVDL